MKKKVKKIYFYFTLAIMLLIVIITTLSRNTINKTTEKSEQYTTTVGTENDLNKFSYTIDYSSKTVKVRYFNSNTTTKNLNIYEKYDVGGVKYTTIVENMNGSFFGDNMITKIDFCGNVSWKGELQSFFNGCEKLTSINFGNVQYEGTTTDMSGMFYNCRSLISIDLSGLCDTSNITDMHDMFYNCSSLTNINLNGWNTSNVKDMRFYVL